MEPLEARQLLAASVIHISVDGLRPDAVTTLGAAQLPNLYRLRTQGAFTDNARTDFDTTVTLTNHTGMVTGRPLIGAAGHGYNENANPPDDVTLHSNKGSYVASVYDVVHDNGGRTGLFGSKSKFSLFDDSYDADAAPLQGGAPDVTGVDNGRDKIDVATITADETAMNNAFIAAMNAVPLRYSLVHYASPDTAGHATGWMGTAYLNAVKAVDAKIGALFNLIGSNPALAGNTAIILTADHGGNNTSHHDATNPLDYIIPFYVWGPGVPAGADLYALNVNTRQNPGGTRPNHSASPQPIRNTDVANLALDLLGLPAVPGSVFNASQNLEVTGTPPAPTRPAAPTGLTLRPSTTVANALDLFWTDNATNETGYKIERSTDGKTFYPLAGGGPNMTFHRNTGLTQGKAYHYRVFAGGATGNSDFSNIASAVVGSSNPTPTPPAAPNGLTASAPSASQINLAWNDNANSETGFRIERSANGSTWAFLANVGANVKTYSNTGLPANTRFFYRVQATGSPSNSAFSNVVNATTLTSNPNPPPAGLAAPTNLVVSASSSVGRALNLSWIDKAGNETGYKIERSTDGKTFSPLAGGGANANFYRNTGLTPGKLYYYRVFAWNASGNSGYSNVASAVAPA